MSGYISVLLQKSSSAGDWGFLLGSEPSSPNVIVTQVDSRCVASELLEPGDRVIELEGMEANKLTQEEVNLILSNPSNRLSMVLVKRRPTGSNGKFSSPFMSRKSYREDVSSRQEYITQKETTEDYNYYEILSRTTRTQENQGKTKKGENPHEIKEGVYKAKPFIHDIHNHKGPFEMKTRENHPSNLPQQNECYVKKDEEHYLSAKNSSETTTSTSQLKKELIEMEEKKKMSNTFWTDPPKDLRSAINNAKFWKSPGSSSVSTSNIFNQLNDLHNQQKKINPREEKRQFWENCSRSTLARDSPGAASDGANNERTDPRSKSCEPEHLKPTNPFSLYDNYRTNSPSNPFLSPSPKNPFYDLTKDCYSEVDHNVHSSPTETNYRTTFQEEEKRTVIGNPTKENRKEKPVDKNVIKSSGMSDFTANREFFERATSVPTISCVKNARDLVSERLSPSHSRLKKPSDFIKKVNAEIRHDKSLLPEEGSEQVSQAGTREKSAFTGMSADGYSSLPGTVRASSQESDSSRRYFTETSYEKTTRVGTPYENVESTWRREYRVATPSGFYDNNFEEVLKEESYVEKGCPEGICKARPKTGTKEEVEEAFKELTRREGLEPANGYCYDYRRQSNQIQNNGNSNTAPVNGPPPPPPPPSAGNMPSVRIASEIGARKNYEPPAAIQNAMMTKDKKPFTYTPGGLNLNEIRSPRMARRISRNAHTEDSCTPQAQQAPTSLTGVQPLPPAALAAMQPQIAVPVFPPGGGAPQSPPPPPPPPSSAPLPPPPLPPISPSNKPHEFPARPEFLSDIASHPTLKAVGQTPRSSFEQQPPEFLSDIANHPPLRPVGQAPRSSYEPQPSTIQVQLKPVSPKVSVDQNDSAPFEQVPFVPRPQVEIPVTNTVTKNQGGSPPIQNQMRTPPIQSGKTPATPPIQQARAPLTPPAQPVRAPPTPPVQYVRAPPTPPIQPVTLPSQPVLCQNSPQTPSTPTLNKSPAPWLTKTAPKEAQPPWTLRQQSTDSQPPTPPVQQSFQQTTQQTGQQAATRVIPIQIEGREPATPPTPPASQQQYGKNQEKQIQPQSIHYSNQQQQYQQSPTHLQTQPQYVQPPLSQQQFMYQPQQHMPPQYQQHGQAPPQQNYIQTQISLQEPQGKTRIIPIQIEGNGNNQQQSPQKPIYQSQTSQPGNVQNRNQNGDADPRKFQTQTSWSGNPTQSRSFRVLQKITGSDDESQAPLQLPQGEVILVNRVCPPQATEPVSREYNGWGTNTPPLYPNCWYNPPQTPEEQQQFWKHYNDMCNYMAHMNAAAMRYSPYPYPPFPYPYPPYPSDTEDYSNSSSDEMTIYGKMFKEHAQKMEQQDLMQNAKPTTPTDVTPSDLTETEGEDTSDTDTEVEEKLLNPIPSIRSVPNINIYSCNSEETSEESDSSEEEETEDESLPHQLSVIYEESDFSSEESRKSSAKSPYESDNSSTSTLKNKDEDENAVKVRLPLQLKFTRSENDEEVATLIVGNSEMEASKTSDSDEPSLIITDIVKEESDPDVTATIVIKKPKPKEVTKDREDSPIDFWKELNGGNNIPTSVDLRNSEDDSKQEESDFHWEDDSSSTSVQTVRKGFSGNDSASEAEALGNLEQEEIITSCPKVKDTTINDENSETDESSEEGDDEENDKGVNLEKELVETDDEDDSSDTSSSSSSSEDESEHSNVFHDNSGQENTLVKKKQLISAKSFEESEDDSGVTSDLSRHISETDTDPECGSELSKMSRYQRAATHSRLFKLLQEECEAEENAEKLESISQRKERLTLPLKNTAGGDDSLSSSSGVNSPSSPTVTDRLVKELIQSLLSRKKGRHFRKLPLEKLHAAALRILQEDMDPYDSVSTSDESNFFLSPVNNCNKANNGNYTDSSLLNPEFYGGNYYDYCNYYSTWGNVDSTIEPDYDIVPSKTFKILQGQAQGENASVKVRCPRVPSTKNLRDQLITPIPSLSSPIPKET